jgi:predicted nucleic acid-binding protein
VILIDASGVLAAFERSNRYHQEALRMLASPQERLLSPFILAELDYLITKLAGTDAALTLLDDVARGVYRLELFSVADVVRARAIVDRYKELGIGLADASIVVLAERYNCHDVLTMDQRHFRAIMPSTGQAFRLLLLDRTA